MNIETIGNSLYWSYANLAMAHAAVSAGDKSYQRKHFIVRSKLYSGLQKGTMKIGPFFDDERLKLILPQACCYCGGDKNLAADHLIPRKRGGADSGDNLVWSCRACNSSKCATDVLVWLSKRGQFPPLLLLRRYLKLSIEFCSQKDILGSKINEEIDLPFSLTAIPHNFPQPGALILWVTLSAVGGDNIPPNKMEAK
jgi:hypothetical protein